MNRRNQNFVAAGFILIMVWLMLRLERRRVDGQELPNVRSEDRARETESHTPATDPARRTVETEHLAQFKERVAMLSKRPDLRNSVELDHRAEMQGLATLRGQLNNLEVGLASLEKEVDRLFTALHVREAPALGIAIEPEEGSQEITKFGEYFSARRKLANTERMRDLLNAQILQEEMAIQAATSEPR